MIERFSSLFTLKCEVTWMLRFICNIKSHIPEHASLRSDGLHPDKLEGTLFLLIKITQVRHFSEEVDTLTKQ